MDTDGERRTLERFVDAEAAVRAAAAGNAAKRTSSWQSG